MGKKKEQNKEKPNTKQINKWEKKEKGRSERGVTTEIVTRCETEGGTADGDAANAHQGPVEQNNPESLPAFNMQTLTSKPAAPS